MNNKVTIEQVTADLERLMHSFAGNYSECKLTLNCIRGNQQVFSIVDVTVTGIRKLLPQAFEQHNPTKMILCVTGINALQETKELYRTMYEFAQPAECIASVTVTPYAHVAPVQADSFAGFGGIGGSELKSLIDKKAEERELLGNLERLKLHSQRLAEKLKKSKQKVSDLEMTLQAKDKIQGTVATVAPFLPLLTSLLGIKPEVAEAVGSLGGVTAGEAANEDAQLRPIIGMITDFMKELTEKQKMDLLSVMIAIQQDKSLIPLLAGYVAHPSPSKRTGRRAKPKASTAEQE